MQISTNYDNLFGMLYSAQSDEDLARINKRETLTTGLRKIDKKFNFPTGYYIVCGSPGSGKGWFALWLTKQFYNRHKKRSVYFNLEMDNDLIKARIHQQWSGLTQAQYEDGYNTSEAIRLMKLDCIIVDDFFSESTEEQTPANFRNKIEFWHFRGYRIFHFDHFHELMGMNDKNRNSGVAEEWAKVFQQICKEYPDIWLFVYGQPKKDAYKKNIIHKDDFMGSSVVAQKCEVFLSLNRKPVDVLDGNIGKEDRGVLFWVDKSRITSRTHVGSWLYFDHTGNFLNSEDEISRIPPERHS